MGAVVHVWARLRRGGALAIGALCVWAGAAQADTYCVQNGASAAVPCPSSFAPNHVFPTIGAVLVGGGGPLASGDTVQIEPGTYNEHLAMGGLANTTFAGDPAQPRPVVTSADNSGPTWWINQGSDGATLRHLEIDQTNAAGGEAFRNGILAGTGNSAVTLDDVVLSATGIGASAFGQLTIKNSTIGATAGTATGILVQSGGGLTATGLTMSGLANGVSSLSGALSVMVDRATISAAIFGIDDFGASQLTVLHSAISSGSTPLYARDDTFDVENSLLTTTTGGSISAIYGIGSTGTVRNVTAIVPGSMAAAIASVGDPNVLLASHLTVSNTIARGGQYDLFASTDVGCTALGHPITCPPNSLTASHDDYRPQAGDGVTVGAGNVSGDPLFVHGTLGPSQDFHLQRGSPAIDSGAAVPVGDTDLDGVARPLRRGPDMGAYESNFEPIAPTITVTAPADGAIFNQNTVVNASYVCLPGLGTTVSSCSGPVASGSPIDTSTIGPHTFKVTAIDADGGTSSTNVSYTVTAGPVVGPSLTGLGQSARRWRRSNKNNTGRHRLPVGTKFTFTLNEPASVTFSFSRSGAGRVMKGTCVKPNRRNRHKRRCALAAGALTVQGVTGANTVAFRGKKLRPGHYVATVAATAGGVTTSPQTLRFTVVR